MTIVGQISLLTAFAASGYASFASIAGARTDRGALCRAGRWAGVTSVIALTVGMMVLGHALYVKDFGFSYVAQYSSRLLTWHYSLSALWVGQAGSLLLWAWMLGVLALIFQRHAAVRRGLADSVEDGPWPASDRIPEYAFGLLMAYLCFLTATMVFAADPMEPSLAPSSDGHGLSPLLQHPAMLIHPPVVFLGYAGWAIPCALTIAALAGGSLDRRWLQQVRPWALFAWAVLGTGILLGAHWSYEELGWGGYWAWDPVENASLIPWLTGTAFLHTMMAWRSRGVLKKTVVALAVATFGLCNFATFLTRSGIFSSLHAFSRSPIGWLFLAFMGVLAATSVFLMFARRSQLAGEQPVGSLLGCEAMVSLSTVALVLLALIVIVGTLFVALSEAVVGRRIMVGPEFYNNALIATGLVLMAAMAPAPLLQWGCAPSGAQKKALIVSAGVASLGTGLTLAWRPNHPLTFSLIWIALCAVAALAGKIFLDVQRRLPDPLLSRLSGTLRTARRQYAGFVAHLGFFCLAVGVTGSSLGTLRQEFDMTEGETVRWADRSIRFAHVTRTNEPDKLVVEAELAISPDHGEPYTLRPAQHLHKLQNVWTTEAAIHPLWSGDFYTILHNGEGTQAHFTFVVNPLLRWIWLGGWVIGISVLMGLWPNHLPRLKGRVARSIPRPGHDVPGAPHLDSIERSVPSIEVQS
jgi:cytochrome c-type biogenesis protein CcmF